MSHPFIKIFSSALKKSTEKENFVCKEAEKLIAKGYSTAEICGVLDKLRKGLIDESEAQIVDEAFEVCCEE